MKTYEVPLRVCFDGYAIVEAHDEAEAEETAVNNILATLDNVSDNGSDKIKHFGFEIHGSTERLWDETITEKNDEEY